MPYDLIGQNSLVSIEFGGTQDGAPTFAAPVTVTGKRSSEVSITAATADLSALEDIVSQAQVTRTSASVDLEVLIPSTGRVFIGKEGHYCRVNISPLSTQLTPEVYAGVITAIRVSLPDGPQTERVTIMVGANGA